MMVMVSATGARATQSNYGVERMSKSRQWVRCEHLNEGIEEDGTKHGSVCTHCTARTRVCCVKTRGRMIHVVRARCGRTRANQPTLPELVIDRLVRLISTIYSSTSLQYASEPSDSSLCRSLCFEGSASSSSDETTIAACLRTAHPRPGTPSCSSPASEASAT